VDKLLANIAQILGSTSGGTAAIGLPNEPGIREGLKRVENWARGQHEALSQQAGQLAGDRRDLASQLYQTAGSAAFNLPTAAVATTALGPVGGMAALGALESADQGGPAMAQGAAEGALMGGALHFMGPGGRLIRFGGASLMEYLHQIGSGADQPTAIRNALALGAMSAIPGGGAGVREAAQGARGYYRLPELSPAAARIIAAGEQYGVPVTAGDVSQSPALKNMEVSLEKVPGAGMQTFRERQQQRALRCRARPLSSP
jgi:hypothetical protein